MPLSKKLAATSIAAGAAAMGLATAADAALLIFDHTSAPIDAYVEYNYVGVVADFAVLHMDGTYKRSTHDGISYTYYDQDGNVTTPIDAADKTADSVYFTYHDFVAAGNLGTKGYSGPFAYTGSGAGVAAHPYDGNVDGDPLYEVEHVNDPDGGLEATETWVHSGLSFTNENAVVYGVGGAMPGPSWSGSWSFADRKGFSERGFVGFSLQEVDGIHYGWAEVSFIVFHPEVMTIYGWGYQTTPGAPAMMTYVPEPATLSLLAIGASGVLARRSKARRQGRN